MMANTNQKRIANKNGIRIFPEGPKLIWLSPPLQTFETKITNSVTPWISTFFNKHQKMLLNCTQLSGSFQYTPTTLLLNLEKISPYQ